MDLVNFITLQNMITVYHNESSEENSAGIYLATVIISTVLILTTLLGMYTYMKDYEYASRFNASHEMYLLEQEDAQREWKEFKERATLQQQISDNVAVYADMVLYVPGDEKCEVSGQVIFEGEV